MNEGGTMKQRPRRATAIAALSVIAALVMAASAGARSVQLTRSVNEVDPGESADWTALCGFPVTVSYTGESRVTLVYDDRSGLVVRETDTGTVRKTYTSASGSYSFHVSPAHFTYPAGASIGSEAIATFVGLQGHAPSFISSNAGLVRVEGTVVDFDGGIPVVDFDGTTDPILAVGHHLGPDIVGPSVCAALS
jgi:hypothetical protein